MRHTADHDEQIGRILSRREILAMLALASGTSLAGCRGTPAEDAKGVARTRGPGSSDAAGNASPGKTSIGGETPAAVETLSAELPRCIVRPEQGAGPFFVDERLERSDLRLDPATGEISEGLPLKLEFRVTQVEGGACRPLAGAQVDVWHCDAKGVYSGVDDGATDSRGRDFLRGYQRTGADGLASFSTIYPGWSVPFPQAPTGSRLARITGFVATHALLGSHEFPPSRGQTGVNRVDGRTSQAVD